MVLQVIGLKRRPQVQEATCTILEGLVGVTGRDEAVSTFLRLLAEITPKEAGTFRLDGRTLDSTAYRRLVGFLPNLSGQWFPQGPKVAASLDYFAALWMLPHPARARERALAEWDLAPNRDRSLTKLSFGQQKRFALALSFIMDPLIWIAEAPWQGLDTHGRVVLQAILQSRARQGYISVMSGDDEGSWPWTQKLEIKNGVVVDTTLKR